MTKLKITSIKSLGIQKTYNVTMASDQHNYAINTNTPTVLYGANSHSCCYGYNSYTTAFLKANYPEEFMCAYMTVETRRRKLERVLELERECSRMGIIIIPRDINRCSLNYQIVRKKDLSQNIQHSEIRPSIHCKGLATAAAENIVANQPYSSIRELAEKTDPSVVDVESITALCDAGFFKTKKEKIIREFSIIREDLKILNRSGRVSGNIFED